MVKWTANGHGGDQMELKIDKVTIKMALNMVYGFLGTITTIKKARRPM